MPCLSLFTYLPTYACPGPAQLASQPVVDDPMSFLAQHFQQAHVPFHSAMEQSVFACHMQYD